jgi:hypothetical protein
MGILSHTYKSSIVLAAESYNSPPRQNCAGNAAFRDRNFIKIPLLLVISRLRFGNHLRKSQLNVCSMRMPKH